MAEYCACCGAAIDIEGRDVCWHCEHEDDNNEKIQNKITKENKNV